MSKLAAAYPPGALVRVKQICGDRKKGVPGLLPIVKRTWQDWAAKGYVPPGTRLGGITVWRIEDVLAVADRLGHPAPAARRGELAQSRGA